MLFVGDDWAEESHDVELQDEQGRRLARGHLEEGIAGIARLHELIVHQLEGDDDAGQVVAGIETGRGPWVQALVAAGYRVYAINPLQVARFRQSTSVSGAKSDPADAHTIADMVRLQHHQLRPVAGDYCELVQRVVGSTVVLSEARSVSKRAASRNSGPASAN